MCAFISTALYIVLLSDRCRETSALKCLVMHWSMFLPLTRPCVVKVHCVDRGFPTINSIPHFHVVSLFVLNWNILEAEICSTRISFEKNETAIG